MVTLKLQQEVIGGIPYYRVLEIDGPARADIPSIILNYGIYAFKSNDNLLIVTRKSSFEIEKGGLYDVRTMHDYFLVLKMIDAAWQRINRYSLHLSEVWGKTITINESSLLFEQEG